MSGIFRYAELADLLRTASGRYRFFDLKGWKGEKGVILRHDIDFDLRAAERMAKLEAEVGVPSTFYIMTTSAFYNPCYSENRSILRGIADMGFDLGLHYDPTVYADEGELVRHVDQEASILESLSGADVRSVSLHNPSVHGRYPLFQGYRNAYDPAIFSNETYMSDSCMDFRGKDPATFLSKAEHGPVQLLLHPMHYTDDGADYPEIMRRYVMGIADTIDRGFAVNWKFSEQMEGRKVADLMRRS